MADSAFDTSPLVLLALCSPLEGGWAKRLERIGQSLDGFGREVEQGLWVRKLYTEGSSALPIRLPNPNPTLAKSHVPVGPDIVASTGARIWTYSSSVPVQFLSARLDGFCQAGGRIWTMVQRVQARGWPECLL